MSSHEINLDSIGSIIPIKNVPIAENIVDLDSISVGSAPKQASSLAVPVPRSSNAGAPIQLGGASSSSTGLGGSKPTAPSRSVSENLESVIGGNNAINDLTEILKRSDSIHVLPPSNDTQSRPTTPSSRSAPTSQQEESPIFTFFGSSSNTAPNTATNRPASGTADGTSAASPVAATSSAAGSAPVPLFASTASGGTASGGTASGGTASGSSPSTASSATKLEDEQRQKQKYLFQLMRFRRQGIPITKRYTMENSLEEIKEEMMLLKQEVDLQDSVETCRNLVIMLSGFIELANEKYDPLGMNLNGWSNNVSENVDLYERDFEKMHDQYAEYLAMNPLAKIALGMSVSAVVYARMNPRPEPTPAAAAAAAAASSASPGAAQANIFSSMMNMMGVKNNGPKRTPQAPPPPPEFSRPAPGGSTNAGSGSKSGNGTGAAVRGPQGAEDILREIDELARNVSARNTAPPPQQQKPASQPPPLRAAAPAVLSTSQPPMMPSAPTSQPPAVAAARRTTTSSHSTRTGRGVTLSDF